MKSRQYPRLTVFVTRPIPKPAIVAMQRCANVIVRRKDSIISRAELQRSVKTVDILVPILTDMIDDTVLARARRLRLIANYGAGYNNIDVAAATKRGILVTNTPDVLTDTTAELTMTLMLAVTRRIVETDAIMRSGKYPGWGPLLYLGHGISGKVLGVIGMGRIGTRVAEIAHHGFGMHILYYTKHKERDVEKSLGAKRVTLPTLLKNSDVVTLHVPLLPETHHLIGPQELHRMKPTAFLINTSRGPVVDERALVKALRAGWIAGAALDVYEQEPKMAAGLSHLQNVVIVPHIGSATIETRTAMGMLAARNVIAYIQGRRLPNCVNPSTVHPTV